MKIRNGFVSNSSSSSFIVFGKKPDKSNTYDDVKLSDDNFRTHRTMPSYKVLELPSTKGNTEFGWQFERYYGLLSKLNFVAIQLIYLLGSKDWWEKKKCFEDSVCEVMGKDVWIKYDYNSVLSDGLTAEDSSIYIDHQSSSREGENLDIFESKEAMKEFLFDSDSYIQGGNDNDDCGAEYMESMKKRYPLEELKENYPEYFGGVNED